jgi:apolipoprotein D and lipocalin family protein
MKKPLLSLFAFSMLVSMSGCASIPKGASAVRNFEKGKYLGKWYEIARFDFAFEKNLNNTTAEYSLLQNGYIGVKNSGFDYARKKWQEAKGKARFRGSEGIGEIEVSFFGPFYADYNVIALDGDYSYALVAGSSRAYLWILSREKSIPDDIKEKYLRIAGDLGYDLMKLVWVEHD